ncbi:hypothetical protein [Photorhabdus luminescens]|uniref:hypothetical protein n=1 Tax=Photorhabdus luminescens TaxID=29488 RepID=UPI00223F4B79|nr:hypothetical protein [Photorhabdus luminescens]MCW7764318.1 hypothetical protein [Photorhabdus luminescens subsp. venezuelensis]
MKIEVGFPLYKTFRFDTVTGEKNPFLAERIHQIGSDIVVRLNNEVNITLNYIEDYDENSTFAEYESRARRYTEKMIRDLKNGAN